MRHDGPMRGTSIRRSLTIALMAAAVAGCTAAPTRTPPPSPTLVNSPTASPAPTPTPTPTPGPTSAPIRWTSLRWVEADAATRAAFTSPGTLRVNAVVPRGSGFLAAGSDVVGKATRAVIWTSPDGSDWRRIQVDDGTFADAEIGELLDIGSGYVAIGRGHDGTETGPTGILALGESTTDHRQRLWRSPDGVAWESLDLASSLGDARLRSILPTADGYLGFGEVDPDGIPDPAVWWSADGSQWARQEVEDPSSRGSGIRAGLADAAGFFAVGGLWGPDAINYAGPLITRMYWTSTDGRAWRSLPLESLPAGAAYPAFASNGRTIVGLQLDPDGSGWSAWRSDDAILWESLVVPGGPSPNGFGLALGARGVVITGWWRGDGEGRQVPSNMRVWFAEGVGGE